MNHRDKAVAYFTQGYNCAQSTAAAFAEDFGLDVGLVFRTCAGFGGGVSGLREMCGAVSAMAYVAGLDGGAYAPGDLAAITALYDLVKGMVGQFVEQHETSSAEGFLSREPRPVGTKRRETRRRHSAHPTRSVLRCCSSYQAERGPRS